MADFGSPVVNAQTNPGPLQTLSSLLSIKGQQQELQVGQANAQLAQQQMKERQSVQQMMQSGVDDQGNSIRGVNGEPDPAKVLPALGRMAPLTGQQVAQNIIKTVRDKVGLQEASTSLDAKQREMLSGLAASSANDPNATSATFGSAVDNLVSQHPEMANAAGYVKSLAAHIDNVPQDQRAHHWQSLQSMLQPAQPIGTSPQPTSVDTGAAIQPGAVNPQSGAFTPAGPAITKGIPPGWVQYEDPVTHAQYIRNAQTGESRPIGSTYANPGAAGGGAPPAPTGSAAPPNYKPGEAATIAANTASGGARYNELVNASAESPGRVNVLDNIIRLAPQVRTGQGSGTRAAFETVAGQIPGFSGAANDAQAYNELSKFLHQSALRAWQGAGGTGTNAQLATIEGANPNTTQDPKTIEALARYNKAGELALQAKATAHGTWMHQPGNNFANQSEFEQQWRQNFDPVLFQLKTASPEDASKLLHGMSQQQLDELGRKQKWLQTEGVY